MAHGITGLDHALVGVQDLEQVPMAYSRLGFALGPRGRHLDQGTATYSVMFPRDHIELTGNLDRFSASRHGLVGVALGTQDCGGTAASLAAAGLHPGPPRDLARQFELPDGTIVARSRVVFLLPEEMPDLPGFICQHLTPGALRRPEWLDHPNGALGLKGLTVMTGDPMALVEPYERLFGPGAVNTTDNVLAVHVGSQTLIFAAPEDIEVLHPGLDPALPGEGSAIALMTLASRDLDRTADYLAQWQIDFEQYEDGSILVPADMACGAAIEFVRA